MPWNARVGLCSRPILGQPADCGALDRTRHPARPSRRRYRRLAVAQHRPRGVRRSRGRWLGRLRAPVHVSGRGGRAWSLGQWRRCPDLPPGTGRHNDLLVLALADAARRDARIDPVRDPSGPRLCRGDRESGPGDACASRGPVRVDSRRALMAAGGVMCWGANCAGWLGNGSTNGGSNVPVDVRRVRGPMTGNLR